MPDPIPLEELDPLAFSILPQAQYSTRDQIRILTEFARKLRMYDAKGVLVRLAESTETAPRGPLSEGWTHEGEQINITGGIPSEEWIRKQRDEEWE